MADVTVFALSKQYVKVPVVVQKNGVIYDPTADVAQMAFMPVSQQPASGDWKTASWETSGSGPTAAYFARCLVGPGGDATPAPGLYVVWVKIADTPETPVIQAGTLQVS